MAHPRRIAIVGLGIMGRRLLGAIERHPAFTPGPCFDPSGAACAKALEVAPHLDLAESAQAAIAGADLVYLACPPGPRHGLAIAAAEAGKPVFLEKPLGIEIADSRDLVRRIAGSGVPAAVNFTQAGCPALAELRRAVEGGETGELLGIDVLVQYAAWPRAWQAEADWLNYAAEGGFTREVISHFVFVAARLLGPLEVVWARADRPSEERAETHLLARLKSATGQPVTILGSVGGRRPDRQEVTVAGARRSYRLVDFYGLEVSDGGPFVPAREPLEDQRQEALQCQLDHLAALADGRPNALATLEEAFAVQERIEAMLRGRS